MYSVYAVIITATPSLLCPTKSDTMPFLRKLLSMPFFLLPLHFLSSHSYRNTWVRILFLNFSCCQLIMYQIKLLKTVSSVSPAVKVSNRMEFVTEGLQHPVISQSRVAPLLYFCQHFSFYLALPLVYCLSVFQDQSMVQLVFEAFSDIQNDIINDK